MTAHDHIRALLHIVVDGIEEAFIDDEGHETIAAATDFLATGDPPTTYFPAPEAPSTALARVTDHSGQSFASNGFDATNANVRLPGALMPLALRDPNFDAEIDALAARAIDAEQLNTKTKAQALQLVLSAPPIPTDLDDGDVPGRIQVWYARYKQWFVSCQVQLAGR